MILAIGIIERLLRQSVAYKQVFIPPCLVNYREEDSARPPRLPEREVRV